MSRHILVIVFALMLAATTAFAQKHEMKRLEINEGDDFCMLQELGAIILGQEGTVKVEMVAPADARNKKYRDVDLKGGDIIIMAEGKRIKSAEELNKLYEAAEAGQEIKLGIKRDGQMKMVSFVRGGPDDMPKGMKIMAVEDDGGGDPQISLQGKDLGDEVEALMDLGVVLTDHGKGPVVAALLPKTNDVAKGLDFAEGDRITKFNDQEISSLGDFVKALDGAEVGSMIVLEVISADMMKKMSFTKPESQGVEIIKER